MYRDEVVQPLPENAQPSLIYPLSLSSILAGNAKYTNRQIRSLLSSAFQTLGTGCHLNLG
jgi:hypothetical protein